MLGYENDCLDTVSGNYKTKQDYSYDSLYQLVRVDGETKYNPHRSALPEFSSTYSQVFGFDSDGLGNMVSKASAETVSPLNSSLLCKLVIHCRFSFHYETMFLTFSEAEVSENVKK